ncbi:glycoside hydrolase family 3 protein [Occallatibacter riparius]|uniref:Glycoside hydrolase family 3 C-terminal domain-containing protein n=1 Tax=Occallatibacter riparius TaxID=1002689 RepID=A0A9J7BL94_9BACT|nr:glycoside hydrolase family 3 C-terminal domain-containing protein [Occallatibacter riparius]UWZ81662.1 glycoside hydrolase family 3 C-terminal domain-containing protein [Occallatibacter riparius]
MSAQTFFTGALLGLCGLLFAGAVHAQAPVPDSPEIEAKAQAMLSKLGLEQKVQLIGGVDSMFTNALPSINLPRFKMSDASVGVRTWGPTTAYAGGVMLAATWDPDFARKLGESLGKDARVRSVNFLLGPGVNIARSPIAGRNFEYLSEDPYLNSAMVVPYIEGVQSQGVIATVKHYAINNQEYSRHDTDVEVDERTMREIYLPAFEAAVTKGHVDSVMNSYNLINGQHATQNEFLNLKVLKGEWGFKGVLMSDWDATYDGVAAANNGLDLEMPSPRFMNAKTLLPAVKSGQVKESTIDDKVLRILRTELRYGFTDRPQFDPANSTYSIADRAVALQGAREGITLLKNEGKILPLDASKIKTIAIIGPDAWPAVPGGGGSSNATAFEPVSIVTGIANLVGPNVRVLYTRGLPEIMDVFWQTNWNGPVQVATYSSKDFTGTPQTANQPKIADYKNEWWGPADKGPRSVRYTASYKADKAGRYLLLADAAGGDKYTISIDGKQVLQQTQAEGQVAETAALDLNAGQTVSVVADYKPAFAGTRLGIGLVNAASVISEEVKRFASMADVAIVAVGYNSDSESEGADRTFTLPFGQDALLEAVAAANPHTIVALTAGGAVDTSRWLDKVPALLHNFYPGQEGGTAIAEVLFGKQNPEGHLPVSFDKNWEDNPSYQYYYPIKGADTVLKVPQSDRPATNLTIGHVKYGDKLMVGYRYWTTTGKQPLFPFGFGLSYATFSFANIQAPSTGKAGEPVTVSFNVTNSGSVAGAEVAQVYVSDPSAKALRPERELKGFEKVRLAPGETKHVSITLDARAFSYWDESSHKWTIDPGKFVVRVGDSSENTPLAADVTLN